MEKNELIQLATKIASDHHLDPKLVCAVIEQESGWNTWAIRFEPAFYTRYVQNQVGIGKTEGMARAISWGLMQVMGQVAREHRFIGTYLSELCNPSQGIDIGCQVLAGKLNSHSSSIEAGLLSYNGGGNRLYAKEVLARLEHY